MRKKERKKEKRKKKRKNQEIERKLKNKNTCGQIFKIVFRDLLGHRSESSEDHARKRREKEIKKERERK